MNSDVFKRNYFNPSLVSDLKQEFSKRQVKFKRKLAILVSRKAVALAFGLLLRWVAIVSVLRST